MRPQSWTMSIAIVSDKRTKRIQRTAVRVLTDGGVSDMMRRLELKSRIQKIRYAHTMLSINIR